MAWLSSQSYAVLLGGCLSIALLIPLISRLAIRRLVSPAEHEHVRVVATGLMTAFAATFAILAVSPWRTKRDI